MFNVQAAHSVGRLVLKQTHDLRSPIHTTYLRTPRDTQLDALQYLVLSLDLLLPTFHALGIWQTRRRWHDLFLSPLIPSSAII